MKTTILALLIAMNLTGSFSLAADIPTKEVQIGLNSVYVPNGFDSAAKAFVVANGLFPNGCYKWSRADVTNKNGYLHEVRTFASVSQGMCIMVLVPFQKEIQLGNLERGTHTLRFLNGDGTYIEKTLEIK